MLRLFLLKKSLSTRCTFSHTDAVPCEWACGISDNHGPRMRQCLRNCHRSENARMAPEPHLHAVEAGRLHSNQKCLHKGRTLSAADSKFPARPSTWRRSRLLWRPSVIFCSTLSCSVEAKNYAVPSSPPSANPRQKSSPFSLAYRHWRI